MIKYHDFLNRFFIFPPSLCIADGLVHALAWEDMETQTSLLKKPGVSLCLMIGFAAHLHRAKRRRAGLGGRRLPEVPAPIPSPYLV